MEDRYCAGYMVDPKTNEHYPIGCIHPAWKMLIIGFAGIPGLGDFGWECTKCSHRLYGRNPFKETENSNKEI